MPDPFYGTCALRLASVVHRPVASERCPCWQVTKILADTHAQACLVRSAFASHSASSSRPAHAPSSPSRSRNASPRACSSRTRTSSRDGSFQVVCGCGRCWDWWLGIRTQNILRGAAQAFKNGEGCKTKNIWYAILRGGAKRKILVFAWSQVRSKGMISDQLRDVVLHV